MTDDEKCAVWAALVAMVDDIHAPQDCLTDDQWEAAERVLVRIDAEIDGGARAAAGDAALEGGTS